MFSYARSFWELPGARDGSPESQVVISHNEVCGDRRVIMAEEYKGEAYCVKCKEKRSFEGHVKVSESGRRMAQGICPTCGTKVNRILGKA